MVTRPKLLASTALAGMAALAPVWGAEPLKLSLGGYAVGGLTLRQEDNVAAPTTAPVNRGAGDDRVFAITTDIGRSDVFWESEVFFQGEMKTDSGLTVGVNIQLEAYTSNDQVDEHYVYLQGGFGKLIVGAENSAPYLLHFGVPSPTDTIFNVDDRRYLFPFRTPGSNKVTTPSTFSQLTNDADKITYFTPRFAPGFQFGLSYTPDDDAFAGFQSVGVGGGTGCKGGCAYNAGNNVSDNDQANHHHFLEAGMNFVRTLNGLSLGFDLGLGYGFLEKQSRSAAGLDRLGKDRIVATTGISVGYAGFTGGLGFAWDNLGLQGPNSRYDLAAGLTYATGPWLVGADVAYVVAKDGQALQSGRLVRRSNDTLIYAEIGGSYLLGRGVKVFSVVNVARWDGNGTASEEATGVAWSTGLALNF